MPEVLGSLAVVLAGCGEASELVESRCGEPRVFGVASDGEGLGQGGLGAGEVIDLGSMARPRWTSTSATQYGIPMATNSGRSGIEQLLRASDVTLGQSGDRQLSPPMPSAAASGRPPLALFGLLQALARLGDAALRQIDVRRELVGIQVEHGLLLVQCHRHRVPGEQGRSTGIAPPEQTGGLRRSPPTR